MGFFRATPAAMPGGVLLFQCLGTSTIGAAWFHGRVRDGIGWFTGAMATRQWSRRVRVNRCSQSGFDVSSTDQQTRLCPELSLMVQILQA